MTLARIARVAAVLSAVGGTTHALAQDKEVHPKDQVGDLPLVQPPVLSQDVVAVNSKSGLLRNVGEQPEVIYSTTVFAPDSQSVRLDFGRVVLAGDQANGTHSEIRITSLADGHEQILNAETIRQWGYTSAYFNGDAVKVELIAHPGTGDNELEIETVIAGTWNGQAESICGTVDDRTLSSDPRAARLLPIGCTGWIINDCERCFLTAGHCTGGGSFNVVEFNVPLSNSDRSLNHPAPEFQYAVDPASVQSNGGQGTGNDWAYFGVFPNSNTGLRPHQAQGDFYEIGTITPSAGDEIRVTGYGSTSSPVPNSWYLAQKTHSGPFVQRDGDRLVYAMDTTGGNSGSAVVDELSGIAFGIHTHAGCNSIGGNQGTHLNHPALQNALANPQGVCFPQGIQFLPAGEILHIGPVGGPFNDASFSMMLENPTDEPLDYQIRILSSEHPVNINGGMSTVTGTLAANSSINVPADLVNPASQPAGIYTTVIEFQDLTNERVETFESVLEVGQTAIMISSNQGFSSSGPVGGPFTGSETYTITSLRPEPVTVQITADQNWVDLGNGSNSRTIMLNGDGDAQQLTFGVNDAVAAGLSAAFYQSTITIDNVQGAMGDAQVPVSLDVGRFILNASGLPLNIPDNNAAGIESVINVDTAFCVGDVDVDVDISHTFRGDVIIDLISPSGTVVRLANATGGSADNIVVTYDDSGTAPDGPGTLADFNDEPAAGDWTLRVSDIDAFATGTLNSWTLRVATSGGDCPPAAQSASVSVPAGSPTPITLVGQSSAMNPLSYSIESLPASGQLRENGSTINSVPFALSGDSVTYVPDAGFFGLDSFNFAVNDGLPSEDATVSLEVGRTIAAEYTMDTDPGWDRDGLWAFGEPQGIGEDPDGGFDGPNVFGTNLAGDYNNNMSREFLTTDSIDLTGVSNAELVFRRWLAIESSTFDDAALEYQINDGNWDTLWEHSGGTFNDAAWTEQVHDISAADGESVRFRWVMGATDGSVTFGGWNIDNVVIRGFSAATTVCLADVNQDGSLNGLDFGAWLNAFNANDPRADQNQDGSINGIDFGAWLSNFNAGCD